MKVSKQFKYIKVFLENSLGLLYLYTLAVLIAIGVLSVSKLTIVKKNSYLPFVLEQPVELPTIRGEKSSPIDVYAISKSTPEQIETGKALYAASCVSCHGAEGKGDGVAGKALVPPARNFHVLDGWTTGTKVSQMFNSITKGIPGTGMVGYDYLSIEDRFALVHFIRSLRSGHQVDSRQDSANLNTAYQLSKGKSEPSQIPIQKAMEKIVEENQK